MLQYHFVTPIHKVHTVVNRMSKEEKEWVLSVRAQKLNAGVLIGRNNRTGKFPKGSPRIKEYQKNGNRIDMPFFHDLYALLDGNTPAPSYGMKNNGNTCWFDAFIFAMLADPNERIISCIQNNPTNPLAGDLMNIRDFMYRGGQDPNTLQIIRDSVPHNMFVNGMEVTVTPGDMHNGNITPVLIEELFHCNIQVIESTEPLQYENCTAMFIINETAGVVPSEDKFLLYAHVYFLKAHYTACIHLSKGYIYYDDKPNKKIRYLKDDKALRALESRISPQRKYNVYSKIGEPDGEMKHQEQHVHRDVHEGDTEDDILKKVIERSIQDQYPAHTPSSSTPLTAGESKGESKSRPRVVQRSVDILNKYQVSFRSSDKHGIVYSEEHGLPLRTYDPSEGVIMDGFVFTPDDIYHKLVVFMQLHTAEPFEERVAYVCRRTGIDEERARDIVVEQFIYVVEALETDLEFPIPQGQMDSIMAMTSLSPAIWKAVRAERQREARRAGRSAGVYDASTRYSHDSMPPFDHAVIYDMNATPVFVGSLVHDTPHLDKNEVYQIYHSGSIDSFDRLKFILQHPFKKAIPEIANIFQRVQGSAPPNTDYVKKFLYTRLGSVMDTKALSIHNPELEPKTEEQLLTVFRDLQPAGHIRAAEVTMELLDCIDNDF